MNKLFRSLITIIFLGSSIVSCSPNSEELLLSECDNFIKTELIPKLKDPKSYEKIVSRISDTITEVEILNEQMELFFSETDIEHQFKMAKFYETHDKKEASHFLKEGVDLRYSRDSILKIINSTSKDKIGKIDIESKYRAKNGLGALSLSKAVIFYYPDEKNEKDRFFLYSADERE